MTITAGQPLTVGISCHKAHSIYGSVTSTEACPLDSGAYHAGGLTGTPAGWGENDPALLLGCALAIAPKSSAGSTNPEDFTVMSIQENCVRTRDTVFDIPANLPECPDGECTCAWFWQGKDAQNEQYMVGFRCKVEGGVVGIHPNPVPPRKGKISGPTQPMYWANSNSNLDFVPKDQRDRPSYNSAWGWSDGAQTSSFAAGSIGAPATPVENVPGEGESEGEGETTSLAEVAATPTMVGDGGDVEPSPIPVAPSKPTTSVVIEGAEKGGIKGQASAPTATVRRKGKCRASRHHRYRPGGAK